MRQITSGIHHITAFVKDAQGNVDFYAGVLGLRLVKKTINFDAPEVYHLYFGNEIGSPGTAITFFPWKTSRSGRIGGGQVGFTTFAVPPQSLSFWEERLTKLKVPYKRTERFSESLSTISRFGWLAARNSRAELFCTVLHLKKPWIR